MALFLQYWSGLSSGTYSISAESALLMGFGGKVLYFFACFAFPVKYIRLPVDFPGVPTCPILSDFLLG